MIKFLHKLQRKAYIQWGISIILSLLFVFGIIFSQLRKDTLFDTIYYSNKYARIDVIPVDGDAIEMIIKSEGDILYPERLKNIHGQGVVIRIPIKKQWETYPIEINLNKIGAVKLIFRGPWNNDGHRNLPILVNYKNLRIDEKIISIPMDITHDNNFQKIVTVKDGKLSVSVDIKLPQIKINDIIKNKPINLYILFSIFVILLLIIRKIIYYLMNFYYTQNSRIDIIMLAIFFILLFIPMSYISNAEKSEQENRRLAPKPQLMIEREGINNFGKQFDDWFNDRFLGREKLISLYSTLKFHISKVYNNGGAIYLSNNNWMFNSTGIYAPDKKSQKEIILQLNKLNEFCLAHNIKFYLLLIPVKSTIYHDILKENYKFNQSSLYAYNEFIKDLKEKVNFPVIYPYEELRKAKEKDFVFFKQSHHWTDWGAYNGYKTLMKAIKHDFSDVDIVTLDDYVKFTNNLIRDDWKRDFNIGHTTRLLKIDTDYAKEHLLKDDYVYYDHKNANDVIFNKSGNIKNFEQKESGKYKAFLFGNSHNEDLLQFLPYSFKKTKYIRANGFEIPASEQYKLLKRYKKEILNFKPDIMILSVGANIINNLQNLTEEK